MKENTPTSTCTRPFDEALFSGYLDGTLPQQDAQKVRLHVEGCAHCASLFTELSTLRESAMSTHFRMPSDEVWPELPQTRASRLTRSTGWFLTLSWLVLVTGLSLWSFLSSTGDPLEIFLVLGLPGGFVFLFVSVLLDRLRDLKTDRYRGIQR